MLLSLVLIALGNILIFGVLGVSLFSRTPTLTQFASSLATETAIVWRNGFEIAKDRWAKYNEGRA
jgi:hypothetical protein